VEFESVNEIAAAGFGSQAAAYQRGRPSYANDAVDWMIEGVPAGGRVLDLAAGTGKLTSMLVACGFDVVAVEPIDSMRQELSAVAPTAHAVAGSAEEIPLPDASVDAVAIAQAFHWFNERAALAEIARVLRPGGRLGLIWNERDDSVPWMARLSTILHTEVTLPYERHRDWPTVIAALPVFSSVAHRRDPFSHLIDTDGLIALVASTSYIGAMSVAEREPFLQRTRELVDGFPQPFDMPYVSDAYRCNRH
jgi:ubiquinone/menaquinone biosynthesis C-methylase UbiE